MCIRDSPCAASDFAGKRFTIEPDLRAYVEGIAHHGSVLSECETIPPRERAGESVSYTHLDVYKRQLR